MIALGKQRLLILIVAGLALPSFLMAETVVFKTGKKQEGKIISRSEKNITLEYKKFGVTIKKRIPLEKIDTIDGQAPSAQPGKPKSKPPSNRPTPEPSKTSAPKPKSTTPSKPGGAQTDKLTKEALALFGRGLKSKAKESLEKAFKANPKLGETALSDGTKAWRDFYHKTSASFRLRAATKAKDVAALMNVATFAHEAGVDATAKRALLTVQQFDPDNEEVLRLAEAWGIRLTAPLSLNLLPAMTQSLYLDLLPDEGQEVKPRRNFRFLALPLRYDAGSIGLSLTKSSVMVYLDEKKKADRRGFAHLDDSKTLLGDGSEPIWEKIVLSEPKKVRRQATDESAEDNEDPSKLPVVANLWNLAPPRGVELPEGRERIKRQTRRPTGYAALYIQVPNDQKKIWFQYEDRPRQEIDLEWVDRSHHAIDQLGAADLIAAVKELEMVLESGAAPMAELALGLLLDWRSRAGSLESASAGEQMDLILVRVLGSEKPGLAEIAWEALVSSPEIDEDLKELLATKASQETLLGLVEVARETLSAARGPTGVPGQSDDGADQSVADAGDIQSDLPNSTADKNVFELLAAVGRSPSEAVANRVVDALLADGTKQSVHVFSAPSPLQNIVRSRLATLDNEELKRTIFLTLLTSIDQKDLPSLVKPAQSVKLIVDSPTHPLLAVGQTLADDVSRGAFVAILKAADLSRVLEEDETVAVFRALTEAEVDLKVRKTALDLLLSQWSPNEKRITLPKGSDPPISADAVEQLLVPLVRDESPDIFLPACKALIKHGKIEKALAALKQLDANTRKELAKTVAKDRSLLANDHLLMFLAGLTDDREVAAAASVALADAMQATPDRWKRMQAIKRYINWESVNALAGGGTDEATAAMKVLRNTAGVGTAEQDELREIRDEQKRLTKLREINERHQKEPSGTYGCVVIADVMLPIPQAESNEDSDDMETWQWLGQQRFELEGLKISTPKAQKDQPPSPSEVTLGDQKLSAAPADDNASSSPSGGQMTLKVTRLLREALKAAADQKDNEKGAAIAKKIGADILPKNATITLKHHQMGTWTGELVFTRTGEKGQQLNSGTVSIGAMDRSPKAYLSKVRIVLEPIF